MRVQVNINDVMVKKIDAKAKELGVSRSSLCAIAIGQYMDAQSKGDELLKNLIEVATESIAEKKPSV